MAEKLEETPVTREAYEVRVERPKRASYVAPQRGLFDEPED